jgi:multicomponent Na+:H+ antiporter subunit D
MVYLAFVSQLIISGLAILYLIEYHSDFTQTAFTFGGWTPMIGIGFVNDSISMLFVLLTIFMWWMILIYMHKHQDKYRNLLFFVLFLEGIFLGLLQTNDLFNMFVFVELITIIVTILVAYEKAGSSFRAAIYYLLINTAGILTFLLGIIIIYFTFGTINIQIVESMMSTVALSNANIVRFAFVLILASVSVKSALFPLFTWLPQAHAVARSGISALLSGIVVKGGVYVFIRMTQMFEPAGYSTSSILLGLGLITALVGVIFAMSQTDLKQILAYSTVSQLGYIVVGLSFLDGYGFTGGVMHIVNHAIFKGLLFLGAGVIVHRYGSKNIKHIRGVFRTLPVFSILMIIGMLAITGAPLLNGYVSKSLIKYDLNTTAYWLIQIVNVGTATTFVKMSQIFFGPKRELIGQHRIQELIPISILAMSIVALGVFYVPFVHYMLNTDISHIASISFEYILEYLVIVSLAYLIYRYIISKYTKVIKSIRSIMISFETANILFLSFMSIMIVLFVLLPSI